MPAESLLGAQKLRQGLLRLLERCPKASRLELSRELGVSISKVGQSLSELTISNRLEWIGPSRGGQWRVIPPVLVEDDGVSDFRRLGAVFLIGLVLFTQFAFSTNNLIFNASSSGYIDFNTTGASKVRILNDGNVGIGTITPANALNVVGDLNVTGTSYIGTFTGLINTASNAIFRGDLNAYGGLNANTVRSFDNNALSLQTLNTARVTIAAADGNVSIGSAVNAGRLFVAGDLNVANTATSTPTLFVSAGNNRVGLGTFAPAALLHLNNDTNTLTASLLLDGNRNNNATVSELVFRNADDDVASILAQRVGANDAGELRFATQAASGALTTRLTITSDGNLSFNNDTNTLALGIIIDGNRNNDATISEFVFQNNADDIASIAALRSGANDAGELRFSTQATGGSVSARMTILPDGNVGIGTTGPKARLQVFGASGDTNLLSVNMSTGVPALVALASDGNVGLGVGLPNYRLEIYNGELAMSDGDVLHGITDEAQTDTFLRVQGISGADGGAILKGFSSAVGAQPLVLLGAFGSTDPTDTVPAVQIRAARRGSGATSLADVASAETAFQVSDATGSDDFLTILGDGNVGIGTAAPQGKLDTVFISGQRFVVGSINPSDDQTYVNLDYDGSTSVGILQSRARTAGAWNARGFVISPFGGFVGISDTSPDANLEVAGTFMVSSSASGDGDRLTVLSDGNVGIGTTTPGAKLDIVTGATIRDGLMIGGTSGGARTDGTQKFGGLTGAHQTNAEEPVGLIFYDSKSGNTNEVNIGGGTGAVNAATSIDLYTGATQTTTTGTVRLSIKSDGNVGIGTTTPKAKFMVDGGGSPPNFSNQYLIVAHNTSLPTRIGIIAPNDSSSLLDMGDDDDTDIGALGYDHSVDAMTFRVNNAERMRIASDGNVGIGDTTPNNTFQVGTDGALSVNDAQNRVGIGVQTPTQALHVSGDVNFSDSGDVDLYYTNITDNLLVRTGAGNTQGFIGTFSAHRFGIWAGSTERISVLSDGNVGIGTATPGALLSVNKTSTSYSNSLATSLASAAINIVEPTYANGRLWEGIYWSVGNDNATKPRIGIWGQMTNSGDSLLFGTNNSSGSGITNTAMAITGDGNVGIGTTTPGARLQVKGASGDSNVLSVIDSSSGNLLVVKGDGNVGIGTAKPSQLLQIYKRSDADIQPLKLTHFAISDSFPREVSIGFGILQSADPDSVVSAKIAAVREALGDGPTSLRFSTYDDAISPGGLNERMRLTSRGNLGLSDPTPDALLDVNGISNSGSDVLRVDANSVAGPTAALYIDKNGWVGMGTTNVQLQGLTVVSGFSGGVQVSNLVDSTISLKPNATNSPMLTTGGSGQALLFGINDTERMRIASDGSVGIRDITPDALLDVNFNTSAGSGVRGLEVYGESMTGGDELARFDTAGANASSIFSLRAFASILGEEQFAVKANGQVGVRDPTPDALLDVNGINLNADVFRVDANGNVNPARALLIDKNGNFDVGTGKLYVLASDGNVGIGTTTPAYKLQLAQDIASEQDISKTLAFTTTSNSLSYGGYVGQRYVNANPRQGLIASGTNSLTLNAANAGDTGNIDFIVGTVTPTDDTNLKMRINSDGNLGVKTTLKAADLSIAGTTIELRTGANFNIVADVAYSQYQTQASVIRHADGGGATTGRMEFYTGYFDPINRHVSDAHNDGNMTLAMKLLGGKVYMPALADEADNRSVCAVSTSGLLGFVDGVCGTSSIRYKENVIELGEDGSVLAKIMDLRPVYFNYKADSNLAGDLDIGEGRTKRRIGFIAEDMLGVFPEVVQYDVNNEPESIDYPNLTAVLAKGVQELDSKQQDLDAQVQSQQKTIEEQERKIKGLEQALEAEKKRNDSQHARLKAVEEKLAKS